MNIFVLDKNPIQAAIWHFDKHVTKMVLESSQMLCTALHINSSLQDIPYKVAHPKHPCTIWTSNNRNNFLWLCDLADALATEYTHRYEKTHKCTHVISYCRSKASCISEGAISEFAQAMPCEYKHPDAVTAYRNFYLNGKGHFKHVWTRRMPPPWWIPIS